MEDDSLPHAVPARSQWFGLIAVAASLAIALWSFPDDPGPEGALFLPALVLTLGILAGPVLIAFHDSTSVFRVENLVMLGMIYWLLLDLLQGSYALRDVSQESIRSSFLFIGLFAVGVWLAGMHGPWGLPRWVLRVAQTNWNEGHLFGAFVTCAGITFLRFALPCGFNPFLMISSLGGNRWSAPWSRGALGGWDAFVDHLSYFGYLLPSLTVLLANRAQWRNKPAVAVSMLFTLALTAFLAHGGGRRIIGVMYGAAVLCWVLLHRSATTLRTVVVCTIAGSAILFAMEMMLDYRGIGYEKILSKEKDKDSYVWVRVDDNLLRLAQIIEIVPERHPHTYEKMFAWALIRPIPRVFWESKPRDPGFDLASTIGAKGVSLTSSVIGEFYLSWGWPAILFGGWLYGRLAGICNRFLTDAAGEAGVLMYALGAMAIFAGIRSLIDLVLMSYLLLAWIALSALLAPTAKPP